MVQVTISHRHMDTFHGPSKRTLDKSSPGCTIRLVVSRNRYYYRNNTLNKKDSKDYCASTLSTCIYRRGANRILNSRPRMQLDGRLLGIKLGGKQPPEKSTRKNNESR